MSGTCLDCNTQLKTSRAERCFPCARAARRIPIPADLADHIHLPNRVLGEKYGVSAIMVASWRRRAELPATGLKGGVRPPTPRPEGFDDKARTMTVRELAKHFRMGTTTVRRLLGEAVVPIVRVRSTDTPDWFAAEAATMTIPQVMDRARVGRTTVARWETATGVRCFRVAALKKRQTVDFVRQAPPKARTVAGHKATRQPVGGPQRDMSIAGQAADFLRRDTAVHRAKADGSYCPKGYYYRYGSATITTDELIARAKRKGFDPDAWKRVSQPRAFGEIAQGVLARCEVRA